MNHDAESSFGSEQSLIPGVPDKIAQFDFVRRGFKVETTCLNDRGLEIEKGWHDLLYYLCNNLDYYLRNYRPDLRGKFYFTQIKEKFGFLRIYTSIEDDYISDFIGKTEKMSGSVCEFCGNTRGASIRPFLWIKAMCRECMWPKIFVKGRPVLFILRLFWNWLTGK